MPNEYPYVGQQFGDYLLKKGIGHGGFADVYLAEHIELGKLVAVKLPADVRIVSAEKVRDFQKEARIVASLVHRNILEVYHLGLHAGIPYVVMQYAPKGSLRNLHPRGTPVPVDLIVDYVKQVAEALQYLHDRGLIHRDVKPENLLIGPHGNLLLSDFGITILTDSRRPNLQIVAGTAAYMSPEQLKGKAERASDQYSLAIIAYELLTGDVPFKGLWWEVTMQHANAAPEPLEEKLKAFGKNIPPKVGEVVLRALAKNPGDRFPSVWGFAQALEEASKQLVTITELVPVLYYRAKTNTIGDIVWSPDSEHLAIISHEDKSLDIIRSRTAHGVYNYVHETSINSVAWSPENKLIAIGAGVPSGESESATTNKSGVLVLDFNKKQVVRKFATTEAASYIAWSPNNKFISIAAGDVKVWEVEQNKELSLIRAKDGLAARYLGWFQDSRHIIIAWARRYGIERTLTVHEAATGKLVSSIGVDKGTREEGTPPHTWKRSVMEIRSLALAPTSKSIAVSGLCGAVEGDPEAPLLGIISIIDLATGQERQLEAGIFGRRRWGPFTESISWSQDERFITAFGWQYSGDEFIILDVATGKVVVDFEVEVERLDESQPTEKRNRFVFSQYVSALAWSPVDYRLAVANSKESMVYQAK